MKIFKNMLSASDGTRFKVTLKQAERAQTLSHLIKDAGTEQIIPLPSIDKSTLARIVRYLQMDPIVLDEINREEYFDLIRAANYLDFRDLLDKLIPMLLTKCDLTKELLVELRGLIFPALFFVPDLSQFRECIPSRNVFSGIVATIDRMSEFIQDYGKCNWSMRYAARNGYVEVVRLLVVDPGVNPAMDYNFAIGQAARNGHAEVVRLLLAHPRVDPAAMDNWAIRYAARHGHVEVVRLLLSDERVDPATEKNYAVRWAALNGHVEVVRLLLANPRVYSSAMVNRAIRWAAENGHIEVVRMLLADLRVDPARAIRWATKNGHDEVVRLLKN